VTGRGERGERDGRENGDERCVFVCECDQKLWKGFRGVCMQSVNGVEEDKHACEGTHQLSAGRVLSSGGRRGSQDRRLPCRPVVDRCMGVVRGELEGHAEVRRGSSAPGR
jgi:hypothetical protein